MLAPAPKTVVGHSVGDTASQPQAPTWPPAQLGDLMRCGVKPCFVCLSQCPFRVPVGKCGYGASHGDRVLKNKRNICLGKVVERSLEVTEKSPKGRRSSFNSCPLCIKKLGQAHTSPYRCVPRATSAATRASQAFTVAKNELRQYSTVMKKGDEGFRYQGQEEQGWARQSCS